jgi:serpin B
MKSPLLVFTLIGMLVCLSACEKESETKPDNHPKEFLVTAQMAEVIAHSNDFGIRFFTEVASVERENMMLSPLSASTALTMLLNGCEGNTYTQIRDMLDYPEQMDIREINQAYQSLLRQLLEADPKVSLTLANAVFYRLGFEVKPPFLQVMDTDFDAHIEGLNFGLPSAIDVINAWASDNTRAKITEVIQEISPNTVMFLMNALYFKGDWTHQFDLSKTQNMAFNLAGGSQVQVPTMATQMSVRTQYGDDYDVLELPYGRTNFSMLVLVPKDPLSEFYSEFTPETWNQITAYMDEQAVLTETIVMLPRFSFAYEKQLNDELKRMGMVDAFDGRANLSGISDESLFVSFVKQDTFVEVNEEGTEAAAVTTIAIDRDSSGPPVFAANRPFVFAIRERTTNTLLFIGSLMNPLEGK